uniref:Uncharacterized protein n=1 Tax=Oryza barthii TaxID=65489 RepID=A0A0D3G445_9ORYZ
MVARLLPSAPSTWSAGAPSAGAPTPSPATWPSAKWSSDCLLELQHRRLPSTAPPLTPTLGSICMASRCALRWRPHSVAGPLRSVPSSPAVDPATSSGLHPIHLLLRGSKETRLGAKNLYYPIPARYQDLIHRKHHLPRGIVRFLRRIGVILVRYHIQMIPTRYQELGVEVSRHRRQRPRPLPSTLHIEPKPHRRQPLLSPSMVHIGARCRRPCPPLGAHHLSRRPRPPRQSLSLAPPPSPRRILRRPRPTPELVAGTVSVTTQILRRPCDHAPRRSSPAAASSTPEVVGAGRVSATGVSFICAAPTVACALASEGGGQGAIPLGQYPNGIPPLSSFLSMFSLIDRSRLPRIHSSPAGSDVRQRASMVGFWQRQRRQLRAVEAEERWAFDDGDGKINGRSHIHKSWFQRLAWASNNDGSGVGELGDGGCCVGSLVMMGCLVMAILALGSLAVADPAAPASRKANPPIAASGVTGPRGDNDDVFNAWELDGGRSATAGLSP